ncbi:unnamed protein product [Paramecium octaurelia]|uniref:Uncharacterized protein n=1 Tax=Paramecium octaurelia TaxID=43137 RepID=A0A8S1Y743_PAROT|nr:unnamed protein product [Paramecium octaurelia]
MQKPDQTQENNREYNQDNMNKSQNNKQTLIAQSIHPNRGEASELMQYTQSHIQQTVLNIIESLGQTIAQILAIEIFQSFTKKTRGWSVHLLNNEISNQRRHFNKLENECKEKGQQVEWQLAREEFKKPFKKLEDLLINKEHKQLLQNILQPPTPESSIIVQPDQTYYDAIDIYHYKSQVIFHNSLQKDKTGADLLEKIKTYKNEFAKFLYFQFIEQGINYLDQLLNYVLINKTQSNHSTLQQLSDYIKQLSTQNDKQQLMQEIQLIIVVFPELSDYFQELQININDNSLYFDNRIELNSIQFEYVLLIYDHLRNPRRKLSRKLAKETIDFMMKLAQNIRAGTVQQMKTLLKNLKKKNIKQEMLIDFEHLSELFISSKLRLFMKMIQQINALQEHDFKDDYLNFEIISQYEHAIFEQCEKQSKDNYDDVYHEPSADVQQIKVQQVLYQFTSVIENAADLEKSLKNNDILEKLKHSTKESTSSIEKEITLAQTIIKLLEILNCIFMFQKLNVKTFLILYQYFQDLSEIQLKIKDKQQWNVDQIPNLYKLLLNFQQDPKQSFQNLLEETKMLISEEHTDDFSDLIKEIEQFDQNNEATFLKNVKQLYYKEFKDHLLKLAQIGTQQFKETVVYFIQQVDP